jgi:hypothetical protein
MAGNWLERAEELGIKPSSHTYGGWRNQFKRMNRWYKRLQHAEKELEETGKLSVDDMDNILAYFQNSYHLRDWLKMEEVIGSDILKELFQTCEPLKLCRDICNGTKHFILNNPSVDKDLQIGRGALPWEGKGYRFIRAAGEQRDLFELAHSCQQAWLDFLGEQGILDMPE